MTFTFRNSLAENVFKSKFTFDRPGMPWPALAYTLVDEVCGPFLEPAACWEITKLIANMKFIPGGRYLYYAGRGVRYYNNCYLLRAEEDTREEWAALTQRATSCLMTGGGIGIDYSRLRESGQRLSRTGGLSSGPIALMDLVNSIGRNVMQGGSRRSAIYASLNWQHGDVERFLTHKNWDDIPIQGTGYTVGDARRLDYDYPAPLDRTNVSLNYDDAWLRQYSATGNPGDIFRTNIRQAMTNGEPGFSFNFGRKSNETLRNACCEITSEDDSDVCNLGSLNLSRITDVEDFAKSVELATLFLLCGTLVADLPYEKVYKVREKNRRLGLGLMGVHEWLLVRGYRYEMTPELALWMRYYKEVSDDAAATGARRLGVSEPVGKRAIAPTGTIGLMAGTTTGIEPLFAAAYKRRYLVGNQWRNQIVVDSTAKAVAEITGSDLDTVETALDLAADPERRLRFQADMQAYVDHAISSTLNLPAWGSELNNESRVDHMAKLVAAYAPRLRGLTFYPDGSRGGQPLVPMRYSEALKKEGEVSVEGSDICEISGKGGTCGA